MKVPLSILNQLTSHEILERHGEKAPLETVVRELGPKTI
jgi:hypothetical protein